MLARGLAAAPGTASGKVRVLETPDEGNRLLEGEILVAQMTNPDWLPTIRRAAALVTDTGGMTCHAAIVARELGVPCVVGTRTATRDLHDGTTVTVDGTHGRVLSGRIEDATPSTSVVEGRGPAEPQIEVTATRIYVNLAIPDSAETVAAQQVDGVGLLRAVHAHRGGAVVGTARPRRARRADRSGRRHGRVGRAHRRRVRAAAGRLSRNGLPQQ